VLLLLLLGLLWMRLLRWSLCSNCCERAETLKHYKASAKQADARSGEGGLHVCLCYLLLVLLLLLLLLLLRLLLLLLVRLA
jgi:hypothetical protein